MAALYAATYPERTRALVLFHPIAHNPDAQSEEARAELAELRDRWGTQEYCDELLARRSPTLSTPIRRSESALRQLAPSRRQPRRRLRAQPRVLSRSTCARSCRPCAYRRSSCTGATEFEQSRSTSPNGSRGHDAAALGDGLVRRVPLARGPGRDRALRRGRAASESCPTPCSRRSSSPTSSARPRGRRSSATARWRELLERHHALVRRELTRYRGEEKDTAGDGFFATFDGPARAIRCAYAIVDGVRELGLEVRAGVHTGECELHEGKVAGLAVVIGARVVRRGRRGRGARLADGQGPRRRRRRRLRRPRRARAEGRAGNLAAVLGRRRQRARPPAAAFLDCARDGRAHRRRRALADRQAQRDARLPARRRARRRRS